MVKAKFFVANVGITALDEQGEPRYGTVLLLPVCRGAANKRWASATPSGRVELTINTSAIKFYMQRVGKELSITMDDASNDPVTHEFVPLEDEFQPSEEQLEHGYRREETCAECGHPKEAHV